MYKIRVVLAVALSLALCGVATAQERGWPLSAVWSPDGETIAVGSSTGIWFLDNGFNDLGFVKTAPEEIIGSSLSLAWHTSGELLAVGYPGTNPSGPIHIIDVGELEIVRLLEYPDIYSPVRWHPSRNLIASGDWRGNTDIWDAVSGEKVFHFEENNEQTAFAWNPTVGVCWLSERMIAAITKFEVYIIDVENDETLRSFDVPYVLDRAKCNGEHQFITHGGYLVDLDAGSITKTFSRVRTGIGNWEFYVKSAAMSPDSRQIATNEEGCRIRVVGVRNREILAELEGGIVYDFAQRYHDSISWHPDGSRFVTVGQLGDIRVWDGQTYELLQRYDGFDIGDELAERLLPILWDNNWDQIDINKYKCLQDFVELTSG